MIFVFGSNTEGRHGAGAAKFARLNKGAINGVPMGLQGSSYAIITKELRPSASPIPISFIREQVIVLSHFTNHRNDLHFQITPIGCGLAGFQHHQIAPMFAWAWARPNIWMPEVWNEWRTA